MSTINTITCDARAFAIGVFPVLIFLAGCYTINVINGSGQPVGVMVDGQDSGSQINDRTVISAASAIGVGGLSASPQTNEVTGFTNDRPPKYLSTPWTGGTDAFNLDFRPVIGIPVTVWIVKGPFATQRQHAIEACIRTSAIWHNERRGVIFTPFTIIDATGDPEAPAHYAFPNGDAGDVVWKPLRDDDSKRGKNDAHAFVVPNRRGANTGFDRVLALRGERAFDNPHGHRNTDHRVDCQRPVRHATPARDRSLYSHLSDLAQ